MDLARCGILIGTAMGGMQTFASACEDLHFKARLLYEERDLNAPLRDNTHSKCNGIKKEVGAGKAKD